MHCHYWWLQCGNLRIAGRSLLVSRFHCWFYRSKMLYLAVLHLFVWERSSEKVVRHGFSDYRWAWVHWTIRLWCWGKLTGPNETGLLWEPKTWTRKLVCKRKMMQVTEHLYTAQNCLEMANCEISDLGCMYISHSLHVTYKYIQQFTKPAFSWQVPKLWGVWFLVCIMKKLEQRDLPTSMKRFAFGKCLVWDALINQGTHHALMLRSGSSLTLKFAILFFLKTVIIEAMPIFRDRTFSSASRCCSMSFM